MGTLRECTVFSSAVRSVRARKGDYFVLKEEVEQMVVCVVGRSGVGLLLN